MSAPRIRIGNQSSWRVASREPYEYALRQGFDAFEWFSDHGRGGWSEDDMDARARKQLAHVAAHSDLRFSVHAPFAADPTTAEGVRAIRKSIAFAGDVSAGVVNIHLFHQHFAREFAESLGPLLEAAADANVRLSLENTPQTTPDHFNAVFGVLGTMAEARDRVGMCLDMGHANLCSATHNDFVRYVDLLGPHVPIIHWHAHENWGDRDSHLPLFTGPAAQNDQGLRTLIDRLLARGFAGSVVFEFWPQPPDSLLVARQRLARLLARRS